jgi:hypothetical protein
VSVSAFSEIRYSRSVLALRLFQPKGPSLPFASPPRNSMGFGLVRNWSFSQQRRVALFRIRSKVFSVAQDSDVLKICEIKPNRNAVLGLAI